MFRRSNSIVRGADQQQLPIAAQPPTLPTRLPALFSQLTDQILCGNTPRTPPDRSKVVRFADGDRSDEKGPSLELLQWYNTMKDAISMGDPVRVGALLHRGCFCKLSAAQCEELTRLALNVAPEQFNNLKRRLVDLLRVSLLQQDLLACDFLKGLGADLRIQDATTGFTLLHYMAQEGKPESSKWLLAHGPELALSPCHLGNLPLQIAFQKGHAPVAEVLLGLKRLTNGTFLHDEVVQRQKQHETKAGLTALDLLVLGPMYTMDEAVCFRLGPQFGLPSYLPQCHTALFLSTEPHNNPNLVEQLLLQASMQQGVDQLLGQRDMFGRTAAHYAAGSGSGVGRQCKYAVSAKVLERLLKAGNAKSLVRARMGLNDETPLCVAVRKLKVDIVAVLLRYSGYSGPSSQATETNNNNDYNDVTVGGERRLPNIRTKVGESPLLIAIKTALEFPDAFDEFAQCASLLIAYGAHADAVNPETGKTAAQMAEDRGRTDIAEIIRCAVRARSRVGVCTANGEWLCFKWTNWSTDAGSGDRASGRACAKCGKGWANEAVPTKTEQRLDPSSPKRLCFECGAACVKETDVQLFDFLRFSCRGLMLTRTPAFSDILLSVGQLEKIAMKDNQLGIKFKVTLRATDEGNLVAFAFLSNSLSKTGELGYVSNFTDQLVGASACKATAPVEKVSTQCVFCLNEIPEADNDRSIITLQCGHQSDLECIQPYIQHCLENAVDILCPTCRGPVRLPLTRSVSTNTSTSPSSPSSSTGPLLPTQRPFTLTQEMAPPGPFTKHVPREEVTMTLTKTAKGDPIMAGFAHTVLVFYCFSADHPLDSWMVCAKSDVWAVP